MAISYYFISRSGGKLPGEEIPQIRFGLPGPASIAVGPSLSATALRRAQELQGKFRPAIEAGKEVLFVAPDPCGFDTLCAMFLVRRALEGRPLRDRLAMLLASYANSERLGLPISCPLAERLSSIALAAKRRGRPLEADGFSRMFEDAVRRMDERGLNPAFDAVLAGVEEWRPEQELLRRDEEEYRKDRERAVRELALWNSNGPPRVEEALVIHQPRSLLFARWAWDDTSASTEGRGFPLVLIRSGSRQGIAVAPGAGLPQAVERLAQLLAGTDPEGGWRLIGQDGADGEYGETGLWSLEGSRLDSTALGELLRTQWVEAVVNGPIRVCDYAAEHGRAQVDGVQMSTGQLLTERAIGEMGAVREGYYRVVRVPLQPEMRHAMTSALRLHLGELLWPLVEAGRAAGFAGERLERTDTGMAVCGSNGIAVASTSAGDAASDRLENTVAGLAAIAVETGRLRAEPKLDERERLLEKYVELRAGAAGPYFRTLQRFMDDTRQEGAFEAQRRLWESQLLMREAGAFRAGLRKVDRLQSRLDYLGVFVIAASVILIAEFLVKPLLPSVSGRTWLAVGATGVLMAGVFGLLGRRGTAGRSQ